MSRDEGFAVMDLSSSWHDDPKWKEIWRRRPDLVASCAYVYTVLVAESWRDGKRLRLDDAWPPLLPYDREVTAELTAARLVDRAGRVPAKTWNNWFEAAVDRRQAARDKWRRANDRRRGKGETIEANGSVCGICQEPIDLSLRYPHPLSFTVDHIVPISEGGADVSGNRQPAHLNCNLVKGTRTNYHGGNNGVTGVDTTATAPSRPSVRPVRPSEGVRDEYVDEGARELEQPRALRPVHPVGSGA